MDSFSEQLNTLNVHTHLKMDYKLFKGVSIEMKDLKTENQTLETLRNMPGVNVMPYIVYPRPSDRIDWLPAMGDRAAFSNGDLPSIERRDDGDPDTFSTHVLTQVNRLRAEGITGKGVTIGVVDTGVDYKHPALGGCLGPGCLIERGHDLVGDAYLGENGDRLPEPDDDPMDCTGHGTHVVGTIAAQENPWGFTGAAPGVKIHIYKVFGCTGGVGNDVLIAAFNQAFEEGADLITASIGGPSGWSEEPWGAYVEKIINQGVPCTLAAGNDGAAGMFYASTASAGKGVISVASVDNPTTPTLMRQANVTVEGAPTEEFLWIAGSPGAFPNTSLPLRAVDFNTTDVANGCTEWPADTEDLSNKIVLIRRGTCFFTLKASLAAKHGARYIVIYNNVDDVPIPVVLNEVPEIKAVAMVRREVGEAWIKELEAGKQVSLAIGNAASAKIVLSDSKNNATGGSMSDFTSWGPTWELDARPLVSGPGGMILSTYPLADGGYGVLSGTSMATPMLAASVALVMEARGKHMAPWMYESFLTNTAKPVLFNGGDGPTDFYAPVPQQGNGLVQVYDAAHTKTMLSKSHLSFNDTDHFAGPQTFTIHNLADKDITYKMSHVPAATAYMRNSSSPLAAAFPNDLVDQFASLKFSRDEVTIVAGGRADVTVTATPDPSLDAARLPVWSGWVNITASDGSSYVLAYQGATGSMRSLKVFAQNYLIAVPPNPPVTGETLVFPPAMANRTFTLPAMGTANATNTTSTNLTLPGFQLNLAVGSLTLNAFISPAGANDTDLKTFDFQGITALGQHRSFPMEWVTRDSWTLKWDGELNDGSFAPEGSYKFVFAALKIFGDPKNKSDWEIVESREFNIKYGPIKEPLVIVSPPSVSDLGKRATWYYNSDKGKKAKRSIWARWFNLDAWFW